MKKRLPALLLSAALLLSCAPAVLADGARDTNFFTPRDHAELDFGEMAYAPVDTEAELARMDELRVLAEDAGNTEAVRRGFDEVCAALKNARTMDALATIYSSRDYADAAAEARVREAERNLTLVEDGLYRLLRDLLASPCAGALSGLVTSEEAEELADYVPVSQEELERNERQTALENEYWQRSAMVYTFSYRGAAWNEDTAIQGYLQGILSYEEYLTVTQGIAKVKNDALGPLYLQMVELRREEAAAAGYDSFADYAYSLYYVRDYTPEQIQAFHRAVKEEIVPVYQNLQDLWYSIEHPSFFYSDYSGDTALALMEPWLAALSDELLESFQYMRRHHLYDSGWGERKNNQGYTVSFPSYHSAFFFNSPGGGVWDLLTAIHEFGHYNNFYWMDDHWYSGGKGVDIAEVHSQALELLFTEFYPNIFGADADAMVIYLLLNKVDAIVQGAMQDELQQFVYSTPGVTLEQINREYARLCREYGLEEDDTRTELYDWVDTPHTFVTPLYYISYAVSAAGSLSFWLAAQEDFYGAVDNYLRFTALDLEKAFQESFVSVGLSSPLQADYLAGLADALDREVWRLAGFPFTDVSYDDWFFDAVSFAWSFDLFRGTSESTFSPQLPMNRAMAVTVLYRLSNEPASPFWNSALLYTDVPSNEWYSAAVCWATERGIVRGYDDGSFCPLKLVTREELSVMLYRLLRQYGYGYSEAPSTGDWPISYQYTDAWEIAPYAREALSWLTGNGLLSGDGTRLNPRGQATRAEVAQILMNFVAFLTQ